MLRFATLYIFSNERAVSVTRIKDNYNNTKR